MPHVPSELRVTRLSTTPVKGLLLHHPDSIELTAHGAVGDRQFYLVDDAGKVQSCTHNPGLAGLSAAYDVESRRLQVTRGNQVLLGGLIEPATPLATDMWGLRLITSYRGRRDSVLGVGATFGVYADVLEPGAVSAGDSVKVCTDS